jgi:hypothetical protein
MVDVIFIEKPDGSVGSARLGSVTLRDPAVAACLLADVAAWHSNLRPDEPTLRHHTFRFPPDPPVPVEISGALAAFIGPRLKSVVACYETELEKFPGLRGKVDVSFVVGTDGTVRDASVLRDSLQVPEVGECLARLAETWVLPDKPSRASPVSFPFVFSPGAGPNDPPPAEDTLASYVARRSTSVRRCYERELARDPTLRGRVLLRVVIETDGSVGEATIPEDTFPRPEVGACIARLARAWVSPVQLDQRESVEFPFDFSPGR